jgi:hypothetical protein
LTVGLCEQRAGGRSAGGRGQGRGQDEPSNSRSTS